MSASPSTDAGDEIFVGSSEMARLMRAYDWASTPLGPPAQWPEALKAAVQLILESRFLIGMGWGPDVTFLYNDAYCSALGAKHPEALGKPMREVWSEIWPHIGPQVRAVYEQGTAIFQRAAQLMMERHGFQEETYYTYSYSPLLGDSNAVEGFLIVAVDETERVINERRLATLRELSASLSLTDSRAGVLRAIEDRLPANAQDLIFSLVYLFNEDGSATRACATGFEREHPLAPETLAPDATGPWALGRPRQAGAVDIVDISSLPDRPAGPWSIPPSKAAIVPLAGQGTDHPVGAIIVGLNPVRPLDDGYLDFLKLLAGQITSSLASAEAYEAERQRAMTLAEAVRLRQKAAEALRRANEQLTSEVKQRTQERDRLRQLFDQAPSFMCLLSGKDLVFELANQTYLKLVGRNVIGLPLRQALPEATTQGYFDILDHVYQTGEPFVGRSMPFRLQRTPGGPLEERFINVIYQPVREPDGSISRIFVEGYDVTEQKLAEEALQRLNETLEQRVAQRTDELSVALERLQRESEERAAAEAALRHAQKIEALGKLTGGIAHDFNNLLQVISGNLQLLAKDIAGNERAQRRVASALAGVARGAKLASQLLAYGRRQALAPKVINIGRLILNMEDILRRALGEEIDIETVITGGLWNTLVDPSQIENAILNLAINARDAMNGPGRLTIEAHNAVLDETYTCHYEDVKAGQYVMIAVADTGCGIAPDVLDHVFEPFFSTKPEGQGTGLGLAMVHGFVRQSGGHVKIDSTPGEGTTVRIYLPRTLQSEDMLADANAAPVRGGTETILMVEDDEEVRETTVSLLADLGYRVLKTKDAQSALTVIESGVHIDLLFTDVVMPGPLRSPELARKARERLPHLAVLFTSGYTQDTIVHDGRLDPGVELLSKPYTREALAQKIRQVLNAHAPLRPAARQARAAPCQNAEARPVMTVLLVEDEGLIRTWTAEMLAELGHRVIEAGTAEDALQALETADIDLMLTDVGLPTASGIELALTARQQRPDLPILFSSGGDAVPASVGLTPCITLLKPYTADELARALADTLRQHGLAMATEAGV
ncbi:hybrid sensor histidine kinase/response regulator [Pedomonas mirosovicensis]|uniref:hybrid sensor histidine kinase/response regulator n=1 Tax=Pedomonas mirosovicensis TaxID=2908641 RepID=UPI0021690109|nr:response regulator [Pedomonas mirosovicensis]MCH8685697.1 response regulator [Pedomonas mirosovicensis]